MSIDYAKYINNYFSDPITDANAKQQPFLILLKTQLLLLLKLPTNSRLSPDQYVRKIKAWGSHYDSEKFTKYESSMRTWCSFNLGDATKNSAIMAPVFTISRILYNMSNYYQKSEITSGMSPSEINCFSETMMEICQGHFKKIIQDWTENGDELGKKYPLVPVSIFKEDAQKTERMATKKVGFCKN